MENIAKVIITYKEEDLKFRPSVDMSLIDWLEWAKTSFPLDWETHYEETDIYEDRFL